MNQNKSIEETAAEYESKANLDWHKKGHDSIGAFIAGAKYQKELSDAREKLLLDAIIELRDNLSKILPEVYCLYQQETGLRLDKLDEKYDTVKIKYDRSKSTLSSVAKKLEGL